MCGSSQNPTFFNSQTCSKHVYFKHNQLNHSIIKWYFCNTHRHNETSSHHPSRHSTTSPIGREKQLMQTVISKLTANMSALNSSQKGPVPVYYQRTSTTDWHLYLSHLSIYSPRSHSLSSELTICSFYEHSCPLHQGPWLFTRQSSTDFALRCRRSTSSLMMWLSKEHSVKTHYSTHLLFWVQKQCVCEDGC